MSLSNVLEENLLSRSNLLKIADEIPHLCRASQNQPFRVENEFFVRVENWAKLKIECTRNMVDAGSWISHDPTDEDAFESRRSWRTAFPWARPVQLVRWAGKYSVQEFWYVSDGMFIQWPQTAPYGQSFCTQLMSLKALKIWFVWKSFNKGRQIMQSTRTVGDLKRCLKGDREWGKLSFYIQFPLETLYIPGNTVFMAITIPQESDYAVTISSC